MSGKREYGDYQTPIDVAEKVCHYLKDYYRIRPFAIVEPTCGAGSFLKSSLLFEANEYYGIEINPEYCEICRSFISDSKVKNDTPFSPCFFDFGKLRAALKNFVCFSLLITKPVV